MHYQTTVVFNVDPVARDQFVDLSRLETVQ